MIEDIFKGFLLAFLHKNIVVWSQSENEMEFRSRARPVDSAFRSVKQIRVSNYYNDPSKPLFHRK